MSPGKPTVCFLRYITENDHFPLYIHQSRVNAVLVTKSALTVTKNFALREILRTVLRVNVISDALRFEALTAGNFVKRRCKYEVTFARNVNARGRKRNVYGKGRERERESAAYALVGRSEIVEGDKSL